MNIIKRIKRFAQSTVVLGALSAAVISGVIAVANPATAVAASCDKVNVIYCGLSGSTTSAQISSFKHYYDTNVSGHASSPTVKHDYHDVQTIYNYVGASKSLVDGMTTSNTLVGDVHRNGEVTVGSKVIATDAWVAARFSVSGAKLIPGTNAYLRSTTSSFAYEKEAALIRVDGSGKMIYAAIIGCGNAVKATPKVTPPAPKPNYNVDKLVAVKGSNSFAKNVSVKAGTHVIYKVTVASTGNAPVTNVNVKDVLPAHVSFVDGTLKRDNVAQTSSVTKLFFSTGATISSLKNGTSTVFTFEAVVGPSDTPQVCVAEKLNNVANISSPGLPGDSSNATVDKSCLPKPTYACVKLTATPLSRTDFNFQATATGTNGAVITAYAFTFGDGKTATVNTAAGTTTVKHSYTDAGTYNAKVDVTFTVPGLSGPQTVTSPACATSVTVKEAPIAECKALTLTQDETNPRLVSSTVTYTAQNGATLTGVSFNWGDGQTTNNGTNVTASHTYGKDGDFTVVATLSFSAGVANSTCQAPVNVVTVMPTCDKLAIDVNNDDKTVTVSSFDYTENNGQYLKTDLTWGDGSGVTANDITGQSHQYGAKGPFTITATAHFTVNGHETTVTSANCQKVVSFTETPTPPVTPPVVPPKPPVLPNTGAGSIIGLFLGASAIGTVGYRWFLGRRLNGEA